MKTTKILSLKERNTERFNKISETTKYFLSSYCGMSILKDNIFPSMQNFIRRSGRQIELMFYPFDNKDIWALNMIREDTFFLSINTEVAVSKEIYAAANELWRIHQYIEQNDIRGLYSILNSEMTGNPSASVDIEADTFARLLLMNETQLYEMSVIYNIDLRKPTIRSVLLLMSLFALPFRCVVIRLFECNYITKEETFNLLNTSEDEIKNEIRLTGIGKRWCISGKGTESLGSFVETYEFNKKNGFFTESKEKQEQLFIDEIRAKFDF